MYKGKGIFKMWQWFKLKVYMRNTKTTVKPIFIWELSSDFGVLFTSFYSLFWVLGVAFLVLQLCIWQSPLRIRNKNTKSCGLTAASHPGEWKVGSLLSDSVHRVFYLYNNSATIHIHLYNNHIYSDHIRERASTWGVSSIISFTHSPW